MARRPLKPSVLITEDGVAPRASACASLGPLSESCANGRAAQVTPVTGKLQAPAPRKHVVDRNICSISDDYSTCATVSFARTTALRSHSRPGLERNRSRSWVRWFLSSASSRTGGRVRLLRGLDKASSIADAVGAQGVTEQVRWAIIISLSSIISTLTAVRPLPSGSKAAA